MSPSSKPSSVHLFFSRTLFPPHTSLFLIVVVLIKFIFLSFFFNPPQGKDDPVSVTDMADSKAHLDTAKETAASQIGDFLRKQDLHVAKLDNFVEAHIEYFKQSLERLQKVQAKIRYSTYDSY